MSTPNDILGNDGDPEGDDFKTPAPDTIPVITQAWLDAQAGMTPRVSVDVTAVRALRTGIDVLLTTNLPGHVVAGIRAKAALVCGSLMGGTEPSDSALIQDARNLHTVLGRAGAADLQQQLERLVPIVKID